MAIACNGTQNFHRGVQHFGQAAYGSAIPGVLQQNFRQTNRQRNLTAGEGITSGLAGLPNGYRHPGAWMMPQKAGALSAHNTTTIGLSGSGLAVGGVTTDGAATLSFAPSALAWPLDDSVQIRTGSTSFAFTVADADGQLISSGEGTASLAFTTNTPLLTASLEAIGSTSFTLLASGAIGAEASASGSAALTFATAADILPLDDTPPARTASSTMTFSMAAAILPTDDASPARTGTANFAVTGALVPYAVGQMVGSTVDTSILTSDVIAAAVWQSLAASFADAGTMGQKLNNAASGGVDYADLASAVWAHTQ